MKKMLSSVIAIALIFAMSTGASATDSDTQSDVTPPIVTDIQIDKLSVEELQRSTITVTAADENSGVSRVNAGLVLMNEKGDRDIVTLYSVDREWDKIVKSNVFQGEFKITSTNSGKYHIAELNIYDNHGNSTLFVYDSVKKSLVSNNQTYPFSNQITVTNKFDKIDLFRIIDQPQKFTEPTVYSFTAVADEKLEATDSIYKDAEIYLMCIHIGTYRSYWIPLYNTYWNEADNRYKPLLKHTYTSLSEIDKYMPNGIYIAESIMLRTKNEEVYFRAPDYYFEVEMPVSVYPVFFRSTKETLRELDQIPDGSSVLFYGSDEISKEFLMAVKNKNKTFIFDMDDAQVVINGTDILESNGMSLRCEFNTANNYSDYRDWAPSPVNLQTADSIIGMLSNDKAAILMFEENTKISEKFILRLRISHDIREAIGAKELYVYAYDAGNNKLNLIKSNAAPGTDGYIEINTDQLYDLVITNAKL